MLSPPDIEPIIRLKILNLAINEYAKSFGANKYSLKVLNKGISHQLLDKIYILYKNKKRETVAIIIIEIDWKKYEINVSGNKKALFDIDTSKPILEQLDKATKYVIILIKKIKKELGVKRIECIYRVKKEIRNNSIEYKKVQEFLGISTSNENTSIEFEEEMEFVIDKMAYVTLKIRHN